MLLHIYKGGIYSRHRALLNFNRYKHRNNLYFSLLQQKYFFFTTYLFKWFFRFLPFHSRLGYCQRMQVELSTYSFGLDMWANIRDFG